MPRLSLAAVTSGIAPSDDKLMSVGSTLSVPLEAAGSAGGRKSSCFAAATFRFEERVDDGGPIPFEANISRGRIHDGITIDSSSAATRCGGEFLKEYAENVRNKAVKAEAIQKSRISKFE